MLLKDDVQELLKKKAETVKTTIGKKCITRNDCERSFGDRVVVIW